MHDIEKLSTTYSKDYCDFLEATYGNNMLSEGGEDAIEKMFSGIDLYNKNLLDIGSGLGGVAIYLANKYNANVIGIELNDWMTTEATQKAANSLANKVRFFSYNPPLLPFDDVEFDIVYSKGVLVHVKDKLSLFKQVWRVLKPQGQFIIDDWLSPSLNQWGDRIQKISDIENLILYAETPSSYKNILSEIGFKDIIFRDENQNYSTYNRKIVARLLDPNVADNFKVQFGEKSYQLALDSYHSIAGSIEDDELLIRNIIAVK